MQLLYSLAKDYLVPQSKFSVNDIPDLKGKVVIVTGGNSGVGKETVKALLNNNARVYILTRNREKTESAISQLKEHTGKEARFICCDLSDLECVKEAARDFMMKENDLHILINNAGVSTMEIEQLTAQGYDLQLGVNALGHFYLTTLLLPVLLSTAKNTGQKVRVINISSVMHHFGSLDFNTFRDSPSRRHFYTRLGLYGQSKFANIIFSVELARRYGAEGIISVAVHPGPIRTAIWRNLHPLFQRIMNTLILYPVETGALTQIYAATSPEIENQNGKYFAPWARHEEPDERTQDPALAQAFWEWCEEQVKYI